MTTRLLFAIACALAGCQRNDAKPNHAPQRCRPPEVETFLDTNEPRYRDSIARAKQWLDEMAVDPIELRSEDQGEEEADRDSRRLPPALPDCRDREGSVADAHPASPRSHTSRAITTCDLDDTQFKQDATSYLRAALLMDRLGLDTHMYRDEIRKIQPRLDAHHSFAGVNQRLAFHDYYTYFGLVEPFPLETARAEGIIGRRVQAAKLSRSEVYDLTHEVFVP